VHSSGEISSDPKDDAFCLCAESGNADFVITLNPKDFPQEHLKSKVVLPREPLVCTVLKLALRSYASASRRVVAACRGQVAQEKGDRSKIPEAPLQLKKKTERRSLASTDHLPWNQFQFCRVATNCGEPSV